MKLISLLTLIILELTGCAYQQNAQIESCKATSEQDIASLFSRWNQDGKIDQRHIDIDCNTAIDVGIYTLKVSKTNAMIKTRYSVKYHWNGSEWLITSHLSSTMPNNKTTLSLSEQSNSIDKIKN